MRREKMKFIYLFCALLLSGLSFGQGIEIGAQSHLIVSGNPTIEIRNGSFTNNGIFQAGNGTVLFSGDAISSNVLIGGSSVTSFYNLEIKKQQNGVTLNRNINISNSLILRRGNLILNSFNIDLGTSGVLVNENELSRVTELSTANPGGKILATAVLNNPNAANPGNLGVYITSIENLGNTVIMRGHTRQLASPFDGIYRYYDFVPQNNTKLDATLRFSYLDADDVDHYENVYQQFMSLDNGASWQLKGLTIRETNLNYIEYSGYDTLGRVTLAHEDVQLSTGQIVDSICAGTNVLVPFQTGLSHDTSNTFIAQLSDSLGSFNSPIIIGSIHSATSGSISALIPLTTIFGDKYRIRVVSSSPSVEGTNNNADITIKPSKLFYADLDGDGYGNSSNSTFLCEPNGVYTTLVGGDCNDNDPQITSAIVYYADHDGDGHGNGGQGNITLNEGFDDFPAAIATGGWVVNNVSDPIGPFTWYQGLSNFFSSYSGPANSYVHVNYKSGSGVSTIRNWLITPEVNIANGSVFKFKTRNIYYPAQYPDRLQVRMSTSGSSINIGSPNDPQTGDFATLLLDINETLSPTGYPGVWTEYSITVTGLTGTQSGRFAFYYYVPNGGPGGVNSSTIGIDDVVFSEVGPDIFADCTPPPPGFVLTNDDCDDSNALVYPGAIEYCNGIDDNCDGTAEDNLAPTFFNLEAHYSLDINVQDLTANNHDGLVYSNTIFPSPGVCNSPSHLSFNAGSNVRIPRSVEDDFTASFWFKTSQVAPSGGNWYNGISLVDAEVCGNTDDWGIALIDGGKVCFGIGSNSVDLTIKSVVSNYNNGAWHHIAATRNKITGEIRLYVDNVLAAVGVSSNTNSLIAPSYIGLGKNNCTSGNFIGALDEIQLYSRVLNSLEITVLATCFSNAAFYPDQDGDGYGDGAGTVSLNEEFDNIASVLSSGWTTNNLSYPQGSAGYFQGNTAYFDASSGVGNSYIAVDRNSVGSTFGPQGGDISNWLISPVLNIQDGARFSFKTRTKELFLNPDRLQVRLSTSGASTNVGNSYLSTGDFSTLLLDINPTLDYTTYPEDWVLFTVTISGQPVPTAGRIAFRYYVSDAGPIGINSYYIGIDDVSFTEANSPLAACEQPLGYVLNNYDCNDNDPNINPFSTEISCNGVDDNCNGNIDDNNALHFDGFNDIVQGVNPLLPQGNSPRTIEAWIKPVWDGTIFSWGSSSGSNQQCGLLMSSGKLFFLAQGNDLAGNILIDNYYLTRTHVALTFDGSTIKLFVNGVLDVSASKNLNTSGISFEIGANYEGIIDELRIWDVARTAE
ncbi:MAG: choice-of-anchor J domain-containing protein, partial [Bacteroidetes bacterium]|nr:choice-of-anchor J domain-containing protein [Bacteroidota bacterium]